MLKTNVTYHSELARLGNGTAEFCKHGERLQTKLMQQLKLALNPAIRVVQIEWPGLAPGKEVLCNDVFTPIFNGQNMAIFALIEYGRLPNNNKIVLRAIGPNDEKLEYTIDIDHHIESKENSRIVQLLAAQDLIRALEDKISDNRADTSYYPPRADVKKDVRDW